MSYRDAVCVQRVYESVGKAYAWSHHGGALKKTSGMDVYVTCSLLSLIFSEHCMRLHCMPLCDIKESKTNTNKISALELLCRYMEEIGKPQVIIDVR